VTADQALAPVDEERGQLDEAMAFVREYLGKSWRNSEAMIKAASRAGIAERTLKRARAKLKVRAMKSKVTNNWVCALPGVSPEGAEEGQGRQESQQCRVAS